jgi:hypothetical protein
MNQRGRIYNVCALILLALLLCDRDAYGSSAAIRNDEIKNAYTNGDYKSTITLLEQDIARLKESASKEKRFNFFDLYRKYIFLAYIHAWKLHDPDTALKTFREVSGLRRSFTEAERFPPFELMYIAEIHESRNNLAEARDAYQTLLTELGKLQEKEHDDISSMITGDVVNLIKYQIDGINLKDPSTDAPPLLNRIRLSSGFHLQMAALSARFVVATAEYDFKAAQKTGLAGYIEQSPSNLSSMVLNYALVLTASASSVDESDEKALKAFLAKYPDSYYSLFLRYYFYKYYQENRMPEKSEGLLEEIEKIAVTRHIEITTGPDERFSSPEKTWDTFRNALSTGDIDTVMECYVPGTSMERRVFSLMNKDQLRQMSEEMGDIERVTGNEKRAEYRIKRTFGEKNVSFPMNFVNMDGEWRMYEF